MSSINVRFPTIRLREIKLKYNENIEITLHIETYDVDGEYSGSFYHKSVVDYDNNNTEFSDTVNEMIDELFTSINNELREKNVIDFSIKK